ncbi:MAG: hypothetical protein IKP34_04655 [Bacteroidales bacterium]|nr:hypothetical protein [Bacteroidales bacterium]MBR4715449.1 hypothetical protein [Bacteroidales bacterium]
MKRLENRAFSAAFPRGKQGETERVQSTSSICGSERYATYIIFPQNVDKNWLEKGGKIEDFLVILQTKIQQKKTQ